MPGRRTPPDPRDQLAGFCRPSASEPLGKAVPGLGLVVVGGGQHMGLQFQAPLNFGPW